MSFDTQLAEFLKENPNPNPNNDHYVIGLLFPADSEHPKFVWVQRTLSKEMKGSQALMREDIQIEEYVKHPRPQVINWNGQNTLKLWSREKMFTAYSTLNQSIRLLADRVMKRDWRGEIIVLSSGYTSAQAKYDGVINLIGLNGESIPHHQDITPSDCEAACKYFQNNGHFYGQNPVDLERRQLQLSWLPKVVRGVKIRCDGELAAEEYNEPPNRFVYADVMPDQLVMIRGGVSEIVRFLGLNIFVFKVSDPNTLLNDPNYDPTNSHAASLMIGVDPEILATEKYSTWGMYDMGHWELEAGDVHVLRRDGRPITALHVEALSIFCRDYLAPKMAVCVNNVVAPNPEDDEMQDMIEEMMDEGVEVNSYTFRQEFIKTFITRPKFEEFFADLKMMKHKSGETHWKFASSPFSY